MKVLLIDNKSAHLELLRALVAEKLGEVVFNQRDPRDVTDEEVEACDLMVISGGTGRSIVKNPKTFSKVVLLAEHFRVPTIGICLGAEAIAVEYGWKLQEMPTRRVGNVPIYISRDVTMNTSLPEKIMAYQFHKWKITEDSESPSLVLRSHAVSKDGIEVFEHLSLPMWGLQFHPEVRRRGNKGHRVFEHVLKEIGARKTSL